MNRRDLLGWISRALAAGVTAVVGIPGAKYLLGGASGTVANSSFTRLMRFKDLAPGRPMLVPVMGQKQDAWVRHDQQVVGRVWLVRQPGESTDSAIGDVSVRAMSSVCPHMGCQVQSQAGGSGFHCPCHRATFDREGQRLPDPATGGRNHAPRNLDDLECRVIREPSTGELWVEVRYKAFETGLERRVVCS